MTQSEIPKQPLTGQRTSTARKAQALGELGDKKLVTQTTVEEYVKPIENNRSNQSVLSSAVANEKSSYTLNFQSDLSETKEMRVLRELNEYSDDNPEFQFMAIVTRKADSMNENNVKNKIYNDLSFPPLYFTVRDLLNFPTILFRGNNNSGGKFLLIICDGETSQPITRYFIAIPDGLLPPEEKPVQNQAQQSDTLALVEKLINHTNQQFERLYNRLEQNNRPQEKSVLEKAIEAKLLKEITEDKTPQTSDANFMRDIYKNEMFQLKMIQEMFKESNSNVEQQPQGFVEKMLANEQLVNNVVDKVGLLAGNIVQLVAMRSMQTNNTQPQVIQNSQPQPQAQPQPVIELSEQAKEESLMKQQVLFNEITAELERLNNEGLPITLDNLVLVKLSTEYADIYPMIINFAKMSDFDTVWNILTDQILSDELTDKYLDEQGDLTTEGVKIKAKVKELYDLWKNN